MFSLSAALAGLAGGALIGAAAVTLMLLNGRIAGISGIAGGALLAEPGERLWRLVFLAGLVVGGLLYRLVAGDFPLHLQAGWPQLLVAGLLVGFGTRMGSGCTSGHGICGIARGSQRSLVATVTFIGTAMLTVWLLRQLGGS